MDQRKSQCNQRFRRNIISHEEHLENTLERRKFGGSWILGGEGMDSPRNRQEKVGGTLAAGLRRRRKSGVQMS
jgi:hypothetical protein